MKLSISTCIVIALFAISGLSFRTFHEGTKMEFIPGGTFIMGLDSLGLKFDMHYFNLPADSFIHEFPGIRVTVKSFFMDRFDVTNGEYKKFIKANPQWAKDQVPDSLQDGNYLKTWHGDNYPKGQQEFPVTSICFYAASAYANWQGKRLPTEAEWEYVAKGSAHNFITFSWGYENSMEDKANYVTTSRQQVVKIGSFAPNNLGIYDITGNVAQFCQDRWRPNLYAKLKEFSEESRRDQYAKLKELSKEQQSNILTSEKRNTVTIRGGSWIEGLKKLRTTYRESYAINRCSEYVGFRCVSNLNN